MPTLFKVWTLVLIYETEILKNLFDVVNCNVYYSDIVNIRPTTPSLLIHTSLTKPHLTNQRNEFYFHLLGENQFYPFPSFISL